MRSASKRILIVDDEEDLTWSVSRSLRKENEQYEVICVSSGDEALEILKQISVDLIISDIRMPGKDGIRLLNYVMNNYPHIKVIIMSAWYGDEIKEMLSSATGVFYIEKPFDIAELKRIIYKAVYKSVDPYGGRLIDLSVRDIIQHNCQRKFNGSINITNGKENGIIHFRSGEIIHAQVGEVEGENAIRDVLNWNDCQCNVVLSDIPIKKTIHDGWKTILENFFS